jgi:acetoacetyl-CoA synthetase
MPGIHAPDGDRSKILGRESDMPLFVVPRDGLAPGVAMTHNIDRAIEARESRRFLPHEIFAMPEKSARIVRQEQTFRSGRCYPVSRSKKSSNVDAIANPARLDWWVAFAGKFRQS